MTNQIKVQPVRPADRSKIIELLNTANLPVGDLPASLENFFVAIDNDNIIGAIGLEVYGKYGLLRSLIVHPDHRKQSVAGKLIHELENNACDAGLEAIYLLTETAPAYFEKKGFMRVLREDVPAAVQRSSEFSHVCPSSAIVMKKSILK